MIKIKGLRDFSKNINSLQRRLVNQNRVSLSKALLTVEAESARRTPIDTGNLRSSGLGNSIVYKATTKGAEGVLFYTANYAVPVHEVTTSRHEVGEAKFLENAIKSKTPEVRNILGRDFSAMITRQV